MRADLPELDRAVQGVDRIQRFVKVHLADAPDSRPASRELLALTSEWLEAFREVCDRHDHERELIAEVEGHARRHRDAAQLDQPDQAADVLFSADRRVRYKVRRYREAIGILGSWLESAPADAPGRAEVEDRVRTYREQGIARVETQRAAIDRMVERGEIDRAIAALRKLIREGHSPEWLGDALQQVRQLEDRQR